MSSEMRCCSFSLSSLSLSKGKICIYIYIYIYRKFIRKGKQKSCEAYPSSVGSEGLAVAKSVNNRRCVGAGQVGGGGGGSADAAAQAVDLALQKEVPGRSFRRLRFA